MSTWFKVWGREVLLSDDLDALTDHEERVWWRLLCVASIAEEEWSVPENLPALAKKCRSTPSRLSQALDHLEALCMVRRAESQIQILNAAKYQSRRPSDSPDATRARKKAQRERARAPVTTECHDVSRVSHDENVTRTEEEAETETETETEQSRALRVTVRELRDEWMLRLPGAAQRDGTVFDDMELLAADYETNPEPVRAVIREIKREGGWPWPSEIRKRLVGSKPADLDDLAARKKRYAPLVPITDQRGTG